MDLTNFPLHDNQIGQATSAGILEGLRPFRPTGEYSLLYEYDMDFVRDKVIVEIPSINMYAAVMVDDFTRSKFKTVNDYALYLAEAFLQALRYRKAEPVPSNVYLGEN